MVASGILAVNNQSIYTASRDQRPSTHTHHSSVIVINSREREREKERERAVERAIHAEIAMHVIQYQESVSVKTADQVLE